MSTRRRAIILRRRDLDIQHRPIPHQDIIPLAVILPLPTTLHLTVTIDQFTTLRTAATVLRLISRPRKGQLIPAPLTPAQHTILQVTKHPPISRRRKARITRVPATIRHTALPLQRVAITIHHHHPLLPEVRPITTQPLRAGVTMDILHLRMPLRRQTSVIPLQVAAVQIILLHIIPRLITPRPKVAAIRHQLMHTRLRSTISHLQIPTPRRHHTQLLMALQTTRLLTEHLSHTLRHILIPRPAKVKFTELAL